ncbi:MAG: phosphate signaling complex protein PhoU [Lachnospiraceae bacterium]|nr:phosphate signaling complex protein PhoU [Lachnospiraceae bacterium]
MRERFVRKLNELHKEMIEMGMLCEKTIARTYQLLLTKEDQERLSSEISSMEVEIDRQEREIESICLQLLLQQQPVATDLRRVSAALKMITDMERIGDQATDIAEIIRTGNIDIPVTGIGITEMAEATMAMVNKSVEAYVDKNLAAAQETIDSDDRIDAMFLEVRSNLTKKIASGEADANQCLDLLMIAKYYERIGDHATNLAEWVEFSITGKHRRGKEMQDVFSHTVY